MKKLHLVFLALSLLTFHINAEEINVQQKPSSNIHKHLKIKRQAKFKPLAIGVEKAVMAFKEEPLSENGIWDLKILERNTELRDLLNHFLAGKYGNRAKDLSLHNVGKEELIVILEKEGFTKKDLIDTSKENSTKKDRLLNESGEIYVHADGSMFRIKDASNRRKYRQQAYYVKSVLKNPEGPPSWQNEAFKVSESGYPIPKAPRQSDGIKLHAPNSSGPDEDEGWLGYIMDEAHIELNSENDKS
ncbi:MAG: hypothetical protein SFT93_03420 [Rickettsiaceae bacterium]|nr:hypothetical protein [Rickettsiaceae bacterium]